MQLESPLKVLLLLTILHVSRSEGPFSPMNVGATSSTAGEITVTWKHRSGDTDGFVIRATSGGETEDVTALLSLVGDANTQQEQTVSVTAGEQYEITVISRLSGNDSPPSDSVIVVAKPNPPSDVNAALTSDQFIDVTWTVGVGKVDETVVLINDADSSDESTFSVTSPKTQYIFTSTVPGHSYTVSGMSKSNDVTSTTTAEISLVSVPSKPGSVEVVATSTPGTALVTWLPGEGLADKFFIYSSPDLGTVEVAAKSPLTDKQSTELKTTIGKTYNISVKSSGHNEMSSSSDEVTYISRPATPSSLALATPASDTISVTWSHGGGEVDQFAVMSQVGSADATINTYTPSSTTKPISRDITVTPGLTYSVWVISKKDDVESEKSATKQILVRPSVPKSVTITNPSTGLLTVTWSNGGGLADGFAVKSQIEGGATISDDIAQSATDEGGSFSHDLNIVQGQIVTVWVTSQKNGISSLSSDPVVIETQIRCYKCSGGSSECGGARQTSDTTNLCAPRSSCWMTYELKDGSRTFTRSCSTSACGADDQAEQCGDVAGTWTCSQCCTTEKCNGAVIAGGVTTFMCTNAVHMITGCFLALVSIKTFLA